MPTELTGMVAIVTGGSSGIGLGTAERLVAEGAKVVIADIADVRGRDAARSLGADAVFKRTDVAEPTQVAELVDYAAATFGRLDIMFNNAGISGVRSPLIDADFADFDKVLRVNLLGVMAGTAYAARQMAKNGGGSVINTASIGGIQATPGQWSYNPSKAAAIHFTRSAAVELGALGVRVNAIAPGNIDTEILGNAVGAGLDEEEKVEMMEKVRAFLISRQPIQIQGLPVDVAEAVLFLATPRSRFITGTVIPVDGGQVTGSPAGSSAFREAIRRDG